MFKLATKQNKKKMSFYSDGLTDIKQLEWTGCDISLVNKTLLLIKQLRAVNLENKAEIMDALLKDYVNSSKKSAVVNHLPIQISLLVGLGIFAISLAAAAVSIAGVGTTLFLRVLFCLLDGRYEQRRICVIPSC
jgi:amino acid permease